MNANGTETPDDLDQLEELLSRPTRYRDFYSRQFEGSRPGDPSASG